PPDTRFGGECGRAVRRRVARCGDYRIERPHLLFAAPRACEWRAGGDRRSPFGCHRGGRDLRPDFAHLRGRRSAARCAGRRISHATPWGEPGMMKMSTAAFCGAMWLLVSGMALPTPASELPATRPAKLDLFGEPPADLEEAAPYA